MCETKAQEVEVSQILALYAYTQLDMHITHADVANRQKYTKLLALHESLHHVLSLS